MRIDTVPSLHNTPQDKVTEKPASLLPETFDRPIREKMATETEVQPSAWHGTRQEGHLIEDSSDTIEALIEQALAQVPESERKIWASMKEALGL